MWASSNAAGCEIVDIFGKNFAGKVQCCKFGASLNLDLYIVGSCGFASVLLMHFDNCPFARQNFLKILDGGTASHLPSLLLTKHFWIFDGELPPSRDHRLHSKLLVILSLVFICLFWI